MSYPPGGRTAAPALLAVCLHAALLSMVPAGTAHAQAGSEQAQTRRYDIPAQPLVPAVAAFGRAAGVQVVLDSVDARGVDAGAVQGEYTLDEALRHLLSGTGLVARRLESGMVSLEKGPDGGDGVRVTGAPPLEGEANDAGVAPDGATILLDAIVVHGEKFTRDLFDTFTSVEVVTSEELDDYVRQSLDEALNSSPNIRMFENSGYSNIAIRGMNAEGPTAGNRSPNVISVSVDGAEQSGAATRNGTRGVWDVEQIEVLRGPQSTLQGRDALAGAVLIKTKNPTFTPEAIVRGEVDSDGLYSGAFAVSGPIIEDQLAIRLSGQVTRDDKDISYSNPNWAPNGDEEFEEFRGKLLFTPSALPGFTGLFTISRTHDKPAYNLVSGPDYFARNYTTGGFEEFRDSVVYRYVADLKYEFDPDWTLQSVTSFVDTKTEIDSPRSATFFRDETRDYGDFSQDIRLTYGSEGSAFSGVLGLYAGRSSRHQQGDQDYDVFGLGYTIPLQTIDSRQKNTTVAIYADGRYEFIDRWALLAGGRLLHDKASADMNGALLPGTPYEATLDEVSSMSNTEFLPKIGLAFELAENQNIAATASKGYRQGFSELIIGTTTIQTVEPETLWAYELAYRSKWLDDRLQINGNVFYYDYANMQVPVPVAGLLGAVYTYSINAEQAHSYGTELEARWNFASGLEVYAGLGLLRTEFDAATYNNSSIAGNEFPDAPSVTASLGANYEHQSGWFVGGDVAFTDGFYSKGDVLNRPAYAVDSFAIANAQAGYRGDRFAFTVYAKNLLDEKYLTAISSSGATASVGDARAFGLQFTQRF